MSSLGEVIFKCMSMYRNRTAQIIDETGEYDTFGALLNRCVSTALKLKELGLGAGDIISSCMYNGKQACIPFISTLFIGAIPATFDPALPKLDTINLLRQMRPKIIFVDEDSLLSMEYCIEEANLTTKIVILGANEKYESFDEFLAFSSNTEDFQVAQIHNGREIAVVVFSSGTTGAPKGICKSHFSLLRAYEEERLKSEALFKNNPNYVTEEISIAYTTLYWISGIHTLLDSIFRGYPKLICRRCDPRRFWEIISKYKNLHAYVPPLEEAFAVMPSEWGPNKVSKFLLGSRPVTKQIVRKVLSIFPGTQITHNYGQTELFPFLSATINTEDDINPDPDKTLTVGKVDQSMEWKVVDPETEKILGPNEAGELRVKSERQMLGYYNMDSSSAFDSEGYLRTGDIFYYDEDQNLYFVDRLKEMFKYRGWHVIPCVIEDVLLSHTAVKEGVIVGMPHEEDGAHPAAVVVLKDDYVDVEPEDIREFVNSKVSNAQMLRGGIAVTTDELPRTVSGKLKRREILKLAMQLLKWKQ